MSSYLYQITTMLLFLIVLALRFRKGIIEFLHLILKRPVKFNSEEQQLHLSQKDVEDVLDIKISNNFNELSLQFIKASDLLKQITFLDNDDKLIFYGLFKQATIGNNFQSKPSQFEIAAFCKWQAWNELQGVPKVSAMKSYIQHLQKVLLKHNLFDQNGNLSVKKAKGASQGTGMGTKVSSIGQEQQSNTDILASQQFSELNSHQRSNISEFFELIDQSKFQEIAQRIQENAKILQVFNEAGIPALHYAIDKCMNQMTEFLLKYYVKFGLQNLQDMQGMTAMHYACLIENPDIIELCLEHCDPFIKDNNNDSAYDLASNDVQKIIDAKMKNK